MKIVNKNFTQINDLLASKKEVVLDLGCGPLKKDSNWIGIDRLEYDGVDITGDVYDILEQIPFESVDKVFSSHFFEHIDDIEKLLKQINQILKKGGVLEVVVPHFSNPYFYSDYTHRNFFGLYTFSYFSIDNIFKRKVPDYQNRFNLTLNSVDLRFKSPFPFRNLMYKMFGFIINLTNYGKEFYEENFSRMVYCYEIRYVLNKY